MTKKEFTPEEDEAQVELMTKESPPKLTKLEKLRGHKTCNKEGITGTESRSDAY